MPLYGNSVRQKPEGGSGEVKRKGYSRWDRLDIQALRNYIALAYTGNLYNLYGKSVGTPLGLRQFTDQGAPMSAALKTKDEATRTQTQTAQDRSGKAVVRPPRPVQGEVDYDALIKDFMRQYPVTRAYLAK
jgi:hypothetical protein